MSLRYAPQTFEPARSQDTGSRGVQFRRALQAMPASEREAAMRPPRPLQYKGGQGEADAVHATAAKGVAGGGGALPHGDAIQKSFGRHDVSEVQAHTGGAAEDASQALGAEAYATGNDVAFADANPTLHTAAHEAAHIVQQKAGVSLKGGVGAEGDQYERHADQVADAVVQGKSAEGLLDKFAGGGGAGVQLKKGDAKTAPASEGAAEPEQCTFTTGDAVVEVPCPEGGQAELDAREDSSEDESKAAPSVDWLGALKVRLHGFGVGESALAGPHKRAIEEFARKTQATLSADPRAIEMGAQDMFKDGEAPWWEMIDKVVGSTSPEGTEEKNFGLASARASSAETELLARAGFPQGYETRVEAAPTSDKKLPKQQWPALRSATLSASMNEDIFDVAVPAQALQNNAGARLRQALPPEKAAAGTAPASGGKSNSTHEGKISAGPKAPAGGAKRSHQLGVSLSPNGGELSYKYAIDKEWPIPLIPPAIFFEVGVGGSIGGSGAVDLAKKTAEIALTGDATVSLTLNAGLPDIGPVKASVYGGGEGKLALKGSLVHDVRSGQSDARGTGALIAAIKVGVKAGLEVPASYLPEGWSPSDLAFQYEYKPGGDYELLAVDYNDGELTCRPGRDLERLQADIRKFTECLSKASNALSSQGEASYDRAMKRGLNAEGRGYDPKPWGNGSKL